MPRSICSKASRGCCRPRTSPRRLHPWPRPLLGLPGVKDVRVRGAIGVVELEQIADLNALKRRFVDEGVWVRPFRNIVYLTPALTIDEADLARR